MFLLHPQKSCLDLCISTRFWRWQVFLLLFVNNNQQFTRESDLPMHRAARMSAQTDHTECSTPCLDESTSRRICPHKNLQKICSRITCTNKHVYGRFLAFGRLLVGEPVRRAKDSAILKMTAFMQLSFFHFPTFCEWNEKGNRQQKVLHTVYLLARADRCHIFLHS